VMQKENFYGSFYFNKQRFQRQGEYDQTQKIMTSEATAARAGVHTHNKMQRDGKLIVASYRRMEWEGNVVLRRHDRRRGLCRHKS